MLHHAAAMIDPLPERITWCYGEWQEAYATVDLVDLMAGTDERVTYLFTKNHHRNTSVLYLVHNLFPKNQGESYHQSELSVHVDVQESS